MNYSEFTCLMIEAETPVLLLEGTRDLPAEKVPALTALAAHLARSFPHARFRTGNAKGSDEAFATGVASVDASRLEFVLPYATHRSKQRPAESASIAIDDISADRLQEVVSATVDASPQYQRTAVSYRKQQTSSRERSIAQLILRDTLKVTGGVSMPSPVAGIFFVHEADPDRGGTGHTMRVCRAQGVPVINQFQWLEWPFQR